MRWTETHRVYAYTLKALRCQIIRVHMQHVKVPCGAHGRRALREYGAAR